MYFELLLLCCAGFLLVRTSANGRRPSVTEKQYTVVWVGIPFLVLILFHKNFSVMGLLCGYAAVCGIFAVRYLVRNIKCIPPSLIFTLKVIVILGIGYFAVFRYEPEEMKENIGSEIIFLIFLVLSVLFIFSEKIKEKLQSYSGLFTVFVFLTPVWGFYIIERVRNAAFGRIGWMYITGNIFFIALIYMCLYCIIPHKKSAIWLCLTGCLIFGLGNYYVTQFKGNPVMPGDLLSLNTAFQVAGGYKYQITEPVITGVLNWYAAFVLLSILPMRSITLNWKARAITASMVVILCIDGLFNTDIEERYQLNTVNQWVVNAFYDEKGSVLGFAELIKKLEIDKPSGYNSKSAERLLEESISVWNRKKQQAVKKQQNKNVEPVIIAVMDETFSDLHSLGDFSCSEDVLKEWYSVDDFILRGNLYVSVYGGGTANSEFEFLTGNSIANCAPGSVPYQIYDLKNVGNLAGMLSEKGYQATAIHPQYKGNWNRMRTYTNFGFETFLGMNDFVKPRYLRGHISDESSFDKVIEVYEESKDKQFIFNVTMQNHGGYNIEELAETEIVRLEKDGEFYPDVETYLTVIRESAREIHKLLDYFRGVEEPVILCIFGDHQPGINVEWIEDIMGKSEEELTLEEFERKYMVPYMIWANYDTSYEQCEMDTSANYLGPLLLEAAGLEQSAYTSFLLRMREEIPVLNAFGYRTENGVWHGLDEADSTGWLADYRMVQYYAMFESERMQKYFQ